MTQISAADVTKLRKVTGAGMMDCKLALQESNGNFDDAIQVIRKKGQAIANKRADRDAKEGVVLAKETADGKRGAYIVLNCETDFVAKNDNFVAFAASILDVAIAQNPADLEALKNLSLNGKKISEAVLEQLGIIGEKLELSDYQKIEAPIVVSYIHPGNKLATLVGFTKAGIDKQVYRDVAMQVAAMDPVAIDSKDVSEKIIEQEKEIGREQARREGKPENLIEKIAEGKLTKFFKESTLLNQDFVKDAKKSVRQYLQETDKELGVTQFKRFGLK